MNISTKYKKGLLYGIPVLIGLYLIYKQFAKNKTSNIPSPIIKKPNTPNSPTSETGNDALPLKMGSKDPGAPLNPTGRVVEMQKLINYLGYVPEGANNYVKLVEDGIFGKKTEAALYFWIQKNTIDTQADYNYLFNMIHPTVPTYDNTDSNF